MKRIYDVSKSLINVETVFQSREWATCCLSKLGDRLWATHNGYQFTDVTSVLHARSATFELQKLNMPSGTYFNFYVDIGGKEQKEYRINDKDVIAVSLHGKHSFFVEESEHEVEGDCGQVLARLLTAVRCCWILISVFPLFVVPRWPNCVDVTPFIVDD